MSSPWGQTAPVEPLYTVVTEPGDEVLATYADGSPAMVLRRRPQGADVFAGTPAWTSEVMRALCRIAGVHLYVESDACVWAAEGFLCIQPHGDGALRLNTGTAGPVRDVLTGEALGTGPSLDLTARRGETRVLQIGGGRP